MSITYPGRWGWFSAQRFRKGIKPSIYQLANSTEEVAVTMVTTTPDQPPWPEDLVYRGQLGRLVIASRDVQSIVERWGDLREAAALGGTGPGLNAIKVEG